ncbi:MAG: RDD family protein [Syntrophomonadaceae bacterium]
MNEYDAQLIPSESEIAGIHEHETAGASSTNTDSVQYRAAGFWIRLFAFLIDLLVIAAMNAILWNLLMPSLDQSSFLYQVLHINALFLGITGAVYFILMTRYFQQTLGKMIFGIKVVQEGDRPLNWITVIFRELIARSLSQLMGLNLGYAVCWFNSEKRCAHDFLSDTWVVFEKPVTDSHLIKL